MLEFMKTILSAVKLYIDRIADNINDNISKVADKLDKKIPTKNSQLENDSDFATVDSVPKNISDLNNDIKYIIKETDPTVPDWAKQETKPEYTAEEVGALPNTLTTLPNPEFLQIYTIAGNYIYDGSDSVNINIPMCINCEGKKSIAFNNANDASGEESFAQGRGTKSSGLCSFSEGMGCTASGVASHAQGNSSIAHGAYSYASGLSTIASNKSLSTLGRYNLSEYITSEFAIFNYSYNITYGNSYAVDRNAIFIYGDSFSFNTETGLFTIENGIESENFTNDFINKFFIKIDEQNVMYKVISMLNDYSFSADSYTSYNISENYGNYSFIIGNGTDDSNRSNAHTLDWEGNAWYSGDIYVGSTSGVNKDEGSKKLASEEYVDTSIANAELITIADIDEICGGVTEGSLSESDVDELMARLQQ